MTVMLCGLVLSMIIGEFIDKKLKNTKETQSR